MVGGTKTPGWSMRRLQRVFPSILTLMLIWPLLAQAATYYIDPTNGDDTRAKALAQSKNTPWKHLRCMASATGNGVDGAVNYTPVAGDIFILKGGETWGNANFPCTWNWSGTVGNRITVTVDQTWFTGASWTRPIFDAGGNPIIGPIRGTPIPMPVNAFIDLNNGNFGVHDMTFDNIEMINFYWAGDSTFNTCAGVIGGPSTNVILDHLYIHKWGHDSLANGTTDLCHFAIMGVTSPPYNSGSVLQNSIIDNGDGMNGGDSGAGVYLWPNVLNSRIAHMSNLVVNKGSGEIAGNDLAFCQPSFDTRVINGSKAIHPNMIETLGAASAFTVYIHDNKIHDSIDTGCETAFLANLEAGVGTIYVWNNILYNLVGNPIHLDQRAAGPPSFYLWNNTEVAKPGNFPCFLAGHTGGTAPVIKIQNNHCITTNLTTVDPAIVATTLNVDHNVLQDPTAASLQGYTAAQTPHVYAPTDGTDTTVTPPGVNLTTMCTGALAGLCLDTTYGSLVSGTSVTGAARSARARTAASWNIGAYQFGDVTPPGAPTPK
jgi:hypothetical protein